MRAESAVVREIPMARISSSLGMVSPTSRLRMVTSEGRTRPVMVASAKIATALATPVTKSTISTSDTAR